ncbi:MULTISPECIES: TadE family protein [Streptomycetaceae]|uniref:TadE family protein n=1 Tax=unclassified Streptomyces TaxID=2593676 RepID=UPI003389A855
MAITDTRSPGTREGRERPRPSERHRVRLRLRPSRPDRGQTAIEFVGVTPLIILLLVALWQCALIGYTFSLAGNAADVGARAGTGAEWNRGEACSQAATKDLPDAWSSAADVHCSTDPGLYRAEVRLKVPVLVPGVLDFPMTVTGDAAAVKEG